jgi:thymidylate synthase
MEITFIDARDLNEAWWQSIHKCLEVGYEYVIDRGSYAGQTRKEFDFIVIRVRYPDTRPLTPIVPEGIPSPSDMEYVEKQYLPYLMLNLKKPNEQYTYGMYIEPQFMEVINMYSKTGFNTNQACMTVGDKDNIYLPDPPCLKLVDTRVRYGKLHFVVYFRSWDLWGGFPSNMAAIQLMKEQLAKAIGVEDGELIALSKGLHLYGHHLDVAKSLVRR